MAPDESTPLSIGAFVEAEDLARQRREAQHAFANVSDEQLEMMASARIIGGADPDLLRAAASARLELERRKAARADGQGEAR
jgi:hypothetical protein